MINSVTISGRICSDVELKQANNKSKSPFVRFAIACARNYKDEDGEYPTDFFECLAFGQNGKYLSEYGYKGREVTIQGRLQQRKYETSKGEIRRVVEIKCDEIALHGFPKKKDDGNKKSKKSQKK